MSDITIINHAHDENEPCNTECRTPSGVSASTILDDDAVAEIEARPWFWPAHDQWRETPLPSRHVILTVAERDALCATVRDLKQIGLHNAQLVDRIRSWSKCEDGYPLDEHINNITVDRERLRASRRVHELDNHHNALVCGYCAGPLKEQLEQVTKERDKLAGDALTKAERLHLLDLLRKERASGDYQGHREWYYKRRDAIIKKLDIEGSIALK